MEQVQQNAVGVAIIATIEEDSAAVDVSAVTTKQLIFRKPDGTVSPKAAAFVNSGTDGKIKFTTTSGFLDLPGVWEVQGYVVFSGGFDGRSSRESFEVLENIA